MLSAPCTLLQEFYEIVTLNIFTKILDLYGTWRNFEQVKRQTKLSVQVLLVLAVLISAWIIANEDFGSTQSNTTSHITSGPGKNAPNRIPAEALAPRLLKDHAGLADYLRSFPFQDYKAYYVPDSKMMFYIDEIDDAIKNWVRKSVLWERHIHDILLKYARPGSTVIDAGAHIGTHTLTLSHAVGAGGLVFAFEPQKKIYRELYYNLKLNQINNVVPLRFALGARAAIIEMNPAVSGNEGGTGIGNGGDIAELRTIDSFGFSNVSAIKIDVEGFEDQVLDGAKETVLKWRPVIIIEIMGGNNLDTAPPMVKARIKHTISKLEGLGYTIKQVGFHDYLAVPAGKTD